MLNRPETLIRSLILSGLLVFLGSLPLYGERLLLQVEDFDGPWKRQTNITGYLGTGFCTSNATPKTAATVMQKTVPLQRAGHYLVWVRAYTSENSPRAIQVEVNGKRLSVTHKDKRRGWSWQRAGEVDMAAGEVRVAVRDAGTGFESADAVLLTDRQDDDPGTDDRQWSVYPQGVPDQASALRFNIDACVALAQARKVPVSKQEWESRRGALEKGLAAAMGLEPRPPATPLNAHITGRAERDGYTVENVVFESRPHFYVTANVYVPKDGPRPLPAVVVTAGHSMREGKNYDAYRTAQLALVRQGFLVLAHDPVGQGERMLPGNSHPVGYPALLVGQTNEGMIVWDTIRALDYLLTRPDVDPKRIGLTGNSGGGENTFYTLPLEPRFAAGASCCFVCSYEAWIKDGGNHCICNHLPGINRLMEEFEIIGLCTPRAFLACNGAKDPIFPIDGTRSTIERAKQLYRLYDAEDRLALTEAPLPHGWSPPLREASVGWLCRWLKGQGDGSPIAEPKLDVEDWKSKDLQCLKNGQMPADAKSYVTLIREEAERLIASYPSAPSEKAAWATWASSLRRRLWDTLGGEPSNLQPTASSRGEFTWEGHRVERLAIQTEPTLEVPALFLRPATASGPTPVVLLLDDDGKEAVRNSTVAKGLLKQGVSILALDVRALGEVTVPDNHCASDAVVLGRPLLAQQAWDVICAARYLAGRADVKREQIALYGKGNVGLITLVAGALCDGIHGIAIDGSLGSLLHTIADPLPSPMWVYAPNLLKVADVPQLLALCAPRPLLWTNPTGMGQPTKAGVGVQPAVASYQALGHSGRFQSSVTPAADGQVLGFLEEALRGK
jgi:cephalosporin-C deacetylase-like acetyl esterase